MAANRDNRRFQRGSGVYTCHCCGKQTRDTGNGEAGLDLCRACYEDATDENYHLDNHDPEHPEAGCRFCEAEAEG